MNHITTHKDSEIAEIGDCDMRALYTKNCYVFSQTRGLNENNGTLIIPFGSLEDQTACRRFRGLPPLTPGQKMFFVDRDC